MNNDTETENDDNNLICGAGLKWRESVGWIKTNDDVLRVVQKKGD